MKQLSDKIINELNRMITNNNQKIWNNIVYQLTDDNAKNEMVISSLKCMNEAFEQAINIVKYEYMQYVGLNKTKENRK